MVGAVQKYIDVNFVFIRSSEPGFDLNVTISCGIIQEHWWELREIRVSLFNDAILNIKKIENPNCN